MTAALKAGLKRVREAALNGIVAGLDAGAAQAEASMKATQAHGDQTGATRASYSARVVGHGRTGAAEHAASVAAANSRNPGKAGSGGTVAVEGIGVILDSGTTYQDKLETQQAGQKAVLGPTLQSEAQNLTQAAADGSRKALT